MHNGNYRMPCVSRTIILSRRNRPAMRNVTIRLQEDLVDELDLEAEQEGVSRSEYIRTILATRNDEVVTPSEYAVLEDECERLQGERDRLQTELDHCQARLDQSLERIEQRMPNKQEVTEIKRYQERGFVGRLRDRLFGGEK